MPLKNYAQWKYLNLLYKKTDYAETIRTECLQVTRGIRALRQARLINDKSL